MTAPHPIRTYISRIVSPATRGVYAKTGGVWFISVGGFAYAYGCIPYLAGWHPAVIGLFAAFGACRGVGNVLGARDYWRANP